MQSRLTSSARLWLIVCALLALLPLAGPPRAAQAASAAVLVKDLIPGATGSAPRDFITLNNTLFFLAANASGGKELWRSDGTTAGTALVKQLVAGPSGYWPKIIAVAGAKLYLDVEEQLWASDGTAAGTLNTAGPAPSSIRPNDLTILAVDFQGALYYAASTASPSTLWRSDGTSAGTVPVLYAGAQADLVNDLVVFDDALYFTTQDVSTSSSSPVGRAVLYRTDGSAAGTQNIRQIDSVGGPDPYALMRELTVVGETLYFYVDSGSSGSDLHGLWKSDGTPEGTANLNFQFANSLVALNGTLYFFNYEDELWRSDGTLEGTVLFKDLCTNSCLSAFQEPTDIFVADGLLYFQLIVDTNSDNIFDTQEVWRSDGTTSGTLRLKQLALYDSRLGVEFITVAGRTYFVARQSASYPYQLWQTDGTVAGTVPALDNSPIGEISAFDGTLFLAGAKDGMGLELLRLTQVSERVSAGLQALYDFNEGSGATVYDVSGVGAPLNLTIQKPSQVQWRTGNLLISGFTPIASGGPASKLNAAAKASNQFTVEAWVTPAALDQYSARIVSISPDPLVRNMTLAQGVFDKNNATIASLRLRTTTTAGSGKEVLSPSGALQPVLTHLVATFGADGRARIYVGGVQVREVFVGGTLASWKDSYPLLLAGELPRGRSWRGSYHLVAFYDRALSTAEVQQNFQAGPEAAP